MKSCAIRDWPRLEEAILGNDVTDDGLAALEKMQSLTYLHTNSRFVTDRGIKSIAKLKKLQRLDLSSTGMTDEGLKDIATLPELKMIELYRCAVTDAGLAHLRGKKLQELGLFGTKVTDRGIDYVKDMTTLRRLDVAGTKVTNAALTKLKGIPDLVVRGLPREEVHEKPDDPNDVAAILAAIGAGDEIKDNETGNIHYLDAGSCDGEPRIWMAHLKGLHNLRRLRLPDFHTEDKDLALLVGATTLETLEVPRNKFSDLGLKHIGGVASLRGLDLSDCRTITSAGIEHLRRLKNLQWVGLARTNMTDEALQHLSKLPTLESIGLTQTKITDAGLVHLAKLSRLRDLNLGVTRITDAGLSQLASLTNLESLSLGGTETTDLGLKSLQKLTKLRRFLWGKGMTRDGLMQLKKHAPNLIVPDLEDFNTTR